MGGSVRKQLPAIAIVATGALVFSVTSAFDLVSDRTSQVVSNHLMTLFPLVAGIVSLLVALRRSGRDRIGWLLFAGWGFIYAGGNGVWEWYEFVAHREVPFPSLADAGYLGGNLCAAAAVATFGFASLRTSRTRAVLDGLIVAASVFIIGWSIVLDDIYAGGGEGPLFARALGLAYPVLDILIVSLIVFVATRRGSVAGFPVFAVGLGLVGWVVSDTAFAYLTFRGTYFSGHPLDAGWIGGDALVLLAAVIALRSPARAAPVTEHDEEGSRPTGLRATYVFAGAAIVISVMDYMALGGIDTVVLGATTVLLFVVVLRQVVMIVENQAVTIARLQSIDAMKDEILNAVSHELRTPLTFIKGSSDLLANDIPLDPDTQRELLAGIATSAERLEELISGLLDLGRLSRGVLVPARRPTEIEPLMKQIAFEVRSDTHRVDVAPSAVTANVDPAQVERIVENLFHNAIRHTPEGTKITAQASRASEGLLITVEDEGPGVPAGIRQKIFEPFYQSPHTPQFGRGTGIGLSLVARFAELHGGRAWFEVPESGTGSRFVVLLPDDHADPGDETEEEELPAPSALPLASGGV